MQESLLIYTPKISTRLDYICKTIFKDILQIPFVFTNSTEKAKNASQWFINYSTEYFENCFQINPHNILFEEGIQYQFIACKTWDELPMFFSTNNSEIPFDIFAASFYLMARYEEYLSYNPDNYGRFPHKQSVAFKNNFLHLPLVDLWCWKMLNLLKQKIPNLVSFKQSYTMFTYDIDMAFSYKHKGIKRNLGALLLDAKKKKWRLVKERSNVLLGNSQDPFDCFDEMFELHQQNNIEAKYFILNAKEVGEYDKNIPITNKAMQSLLLQLKFQGEIGIHPSYQSHDDTKILAAEIDSLEYTLHQAVEESRQHYIKYTLPQSFENLIQLGIKKDFSTGYGSINGFRASTCSAHYWFNLSANKITSLELIPFCWMDANSYYEQNDSASDAYKEFMDMKNICESVQGLFVSIWHNFIIGYKANMKPWNALHKKIIEESK